MRSSTRAAPPLDVSRRHSVSSQDNRIFGSWIQPRPVTWRTRDRFSPRSKKYPQVFGK
jgi:hypothetical protein